MGALSHALENDKSIQRLPAIKLRNIDSKDQAFFYTQQSQVNLDSKSKVNFTKEMNENPSISNVSSHLLRNQVGVPGSLLDKSVNLKDILRNSKVRKDSKQLSLHSSQIFTNSQTII